MNNLHTSSKKFSDQDISHLIQKASTFQQHKIKSSKDDFFLNEDEDFSSKQPSWKKSLIIPAAFFIFICSAFYLYLMHSKTESSLKHMGTNTLISSKKQILLQRAPPTYLQLAASIKELAKIRSEGLELAAVDLSFILDENKKNALPNFQQIFTQAVSTYANAENEQKMFIKKELEHLFDDLRPEKFEHLELFRVLVHEAKLEPYFSDALLKKMNKPLQISPEKIQIDMSAVHKQTQMITKTRN